VAISFCRHRSVPVPCENGSAETTVAEGGRNGEMTHADNVVNQRHFGTDQADVRLRNNPEIPDHALVLAEFAVS